MIKHITNDFDDEMDYEQLGIEEEAEEWCEPQGTLTNNLKLANGFEFQYLNNAASKCSVFIPGMNETDAFEKFEKKVKSYMGIEAIKRAYLHY